MAEITDQEYVESIVKPLVENPEEVVTSRTVDEMGVLIQLTLNRSDMGKVIGRDGRTAKAIRSLLRVFGSKSNARINLKIVEPEGGEPAPEKVKKEETESIPEEKPTSEEKATSVI
ncbi:MAG: KH domain-containing protein [Candidatus Berkelbacteria bacterium]|nr:MAG: KH domain-containing protein [Candidatus Berkelbacteria bacterium]QQG52010.1 MAG: KH domain-containing protein [Candidatus Berkelbacteria bacterium]